MKKLFADKAWEDYKHWKEAKKNLSRKMNSLIADIERNHYAGLEKPEPLRHRWSSWWSRRIDEDASNDLPCRSGRH